MEKRNVDQEVIETEDGNLVLSHEKETEDRDKKAKKWDPTDISKVINPLRLSLQYRDCALPVICTLSILYILQNFQTPFKGKRSVVFQ